MAVGEITKLEVPEILPVNISVKETYRRARRIMELFCEEDDVTQKTTEQHISVLSSRAIILSEQDESEAPDSLMRYEYVKFRQVKYERQKRKFIPLSLGELAMRGGADTADGVFVTAMVGLSNIRGTVTEQKQTYNLTDSNNFQGVDRGFIEAVAAVRVKIDEDKSLQELLHSQTQR